MAAPASASLRADLPACRLRHVAPFQSGSAGAHQRPFSRQPAAPGGQARACAAEHAPPPQQQQGQPKGLQLPAKILPSDSSAGAGRPARAAGSTGLSRRQAMSAAAACAGVALAEAVLLPRPAAAADGAALMVAPPTAQVPQGGRAPRGDTLRRIGRVAHSEEEWRSLLTPAQYVTLRQASTERPTSSPLYTESRVGTFKCAGCGSPLFSSATKFDAGTGWPSFFAALPGATMETNDFSAGMRRIEVRCSACQGHLGHVFRDGPPPTNLRYCMNGVAMTFEPAARAA